MTIRLLALLIVLVLPLTSGAAERQRLEDRVVEHRLANGLTVLIVERHQSPVVSINMTFDVGGLNEQTGQTGIAHLYEHMAFKGTPTLGTKDYARERPLLDETQRLQHEIESLRAQLRVRGEEEASSAELATLRAAFKEAQDRAGDWVVGNEMAQLYQRHGAVGLNASTGKDVTRYTVSLPANRLPLWAAIESDRMQHPVLREFFKERAVVLEERRLRTEDSPIGLLYETFAAAAYQAHPYGFPTIGWASDIASLTPEATEAFFKTYYGPGNAAVAIVGDVNARDTIALIERTFGTITNPGATPSVVTVEPPQRGERRVEVQYNAEPVLAIGYHKPGIGHPDDYVFDVLDAVLSEGQTSRLYAKLVRELRVATTVGTDTNFPGAKAPSLFVINAAPRAPHTVRDVEEAIYAELDRLTREPVSRRELDKVLNNIDAELVRSLRSNSGLASQLAFFQTVAKDWRYVLKARDRVAAVTPEDIQRVAKHYLSPANRTVAWIAKPR